LVQLQQACWRLHRKRVRGSASAFRWGTIITITAPASLSLHGTLWLRHLWSLTPGIARRLSSRIPDTMRPCRDTFMAAITTAIATAIIAVTTATTRPATMDAAVTGEDMNTASVSSPHVADTQCIPLIVTKK
jgi:hypothetical protein